MANIKSAKKRILVAAKKTMRNKTVKTGMKNSIKKIFVAIENNDKEQAGIALNNATRTIDKAHTKGILHKNTAAKKKSRLTKLVNKMEA